MLWVIFIQGLQDTGSNGTNAHIANVTIKCRVPPDDEQDV